jgi:hypothetical protein
MVWLGLYGMEGDTVGARFAFAAIIVSSDRLIRLVRGSLNRPSRPTWHFSDPTAFDIVPVCNSTIEKNVE